MDVMLCKIGRLSDTPGSTRVRRIKYETFRLSDESKFDEVSHSLASFN